jgi:hypothetical protein
MLSAALSCLPLSRPPLSRLHRTPAGAPSSQQGLASPSAVEAQRDYVRTGDAWHRTLAVIGYPREVNQGWLAPLLHAAGELDLTLHIGPIR